MVHEVKFKGQIIDPKEIQVTWSDHFGTIMNGSIEDYGSSEYNDAWGGCEAGEGW